MRYLSTLCIFLLGGLFLLAPNSFPQGTKDQLYMVREEVAKVNMWDQYESTSKQ